MVNAATVLIEKGAPPHLHHMDPDTAYGASKIGMWLFLATEILLFGVLFALFGLFRWRELALFHHASRELTWQLGAVNTVVLLFSSYTAAMAVDSVQRNQNGRLIKNLIITIGCAGIFLVIKTIEYTAKYKHGIFPGGAHIHDFGAFFGLYFVMTGLHGLHVLIGMAFLGWVLLKASQGRYSSRYYTPVEMGVLYWHIVDLIWIYLFPLLYLVG
jgi:cytochrome c oxidase subunit III